MDSYAERQARINQKIEDFKISMFEVFGGVGMWVSTMVNVLVPISQLVPLLSLIGTAMSWIKGLQWASIWSGIKGAVYSARIQMLMMNRELLTGQFVSNGFLVNITRATLAVVRFATAGIFQALKGLGALVLSFVTGGAASATFSGIASASFGAFKLSATTACRAVGTAIMNIPIIGWIAAAVAALVALVTHFWNTSAKFRAVLKGLWASFKACFSGIWDMAKNLFGGIGDLIKAAFSLDGDGITKALNRMKSGFADYGKQIGQAFSTAYNAEMEASKKEQEEKAQSEPGVPDPMASVPTVEVPSVTTPSVDPTGGSLGTVSGSKTAADKVKNVSVHVEKLVEKFEIHTTNIQGDISRVKDMVSEALLSALNDVNLAV